MNPSSSPTVQKMKSVSCVEKTLSQESARTDGYLALMHVIANASRVFHQPQQQLDALALVFGHVFQGVVGHIEEYQ